MIMDNYIPVDDLVIGGIYRLRSRNLDVGVWDGENFIGIREKLGGRFLDKSEVPEWTAWALEEIGAIASDITLKVILAVICKSCGRTVHWSGPPAPAPWVHDDDGTELEDDAVPRALENVALFDALDQYQT